MLAVGTLAILDKEQIRGTIAINTDAHLLAGFSL
jgi:hypothetical protein